MTAKIVTKPAAKPASRTQAPKITGILVRDPLNGPRARQSRPGLIWSRGVSEGEALYFHENPKVSYLPHPVGSKDFRRMLDEIELDDFEKPSVKKAEPESEKEPASSTEE